MTASAKTRNDLMFENRGKYNCTRHTIRVIQRNADRLRHLPEPGSRWIFCDTDLPSSLNLRDLRWDGIINKVGEELAGSTYVSVYQTREEAYEVLEDALEREDENSGLLPCCSNSWIKNERGVDGITCGKCDTIHTREELEV